jgi:hypothetical protein
VHVKPVPRFGGLIVAVVLVLLLGACSSNKSGPSSKVTLPTTVDGVRLDRPPPGTVPTLSEQDAHATLAAANDLQGASRVDSVLAVVTFSTTDHVLCWVFIGHDVPYVGKGGAGPGKATVVEPVGIDARRVLFSQLSQTS